MNLFLIIALAVSGMYASAGEISEKDFPSFARNLQYQKKHIFGVWEKTTASGWGYTVYPVQGASNRILVVNRRPPGSSQYDPRMGFYRFRSKHKMFELEAYFGDGFYGKRSNEFLVILPSDPSDKASSTRLHRLIGPRGKSGGDVGWSTLIGELRRDEE